MTIHTITFDPSIFVAGGSEPTSLTVTAKAYRPAGWPIPLDVGFGVKNEIEKTVTPEDPTLDLVGTGVDWCWKFTVRHRDVDTQWIKYSFLTADTTFLALASLDPETLSVEAPLDPAWLIALAQETAERRAGENGEQAWADVSYVGSTIAGIANTPVAIDGACLVVPPSETAQVVRFASPYNLTVVGGGFFTLQLYDYTNGSAALKAYSQRRIDPAHPVTNAGDLVTGFRRIAPHDDYRVLQAYFTLGRDVGSSLQLGVPNLGVDYAKSLMEVIKV